MRVIFRYTKFFSDYVFTELKRGCDGAKISRMGEREKKNASHARLNFVTSCKKSLFVVRYDIQILDK